MAIQKLRNYDNGTLYPNTQIDALLDADGNEGGVAISAAIRKSAENIPGSSLQGSSLLALGPDGMAKLQVPTDDAYVLTNAGFIRESEITYNVGSLDQETLYKNARGRVAVNIDTDDLAIGSDGIRLNLDDDGTLLTTIDGRIDEKVPSASIMATVTKSSEIVSLASGLTSTLTISLTEGVPSMGKYLQPSAGEIYRLDTDLKETTVSRLGGGDARWVYDGSKYAFILKYADTAGITDTFGVRLAYGSATYHANFSIICADRLLERGIVADLDNEAYAVAVGKDGRTVASYSFSTTPIVTYGTESLGYENVADPSAVGKGRWTYKSVTPDPGIGLPASCVSVDSSTHAVKFVIPAGTSVGSSNGKVAVAIEANADGTAVIAEMNFTLFAFESATVTDVYSLLPSIPQIKRTEGTDGTYSYDPSSVSCTLKSNSGKDAAEITVASVAQQGLYVVYSNGKDANGNVNWWLYDGPIAESTFNSRFSGKDHILLELVLSAVKGSTDVSAIMSSYGVMDYEDVCFIEDGKPGEDGNSVQYIYKLTDTLSAPTVPLKSECSFVDGEWVPNDTTWTDDPTGVSSAHMYEWVSSIKFVSGAWQAAFSAAGLWAAYGTKGDKGDKGDAGSSNVSIDLSNDMTSVACNSLGQPASGVASTTARLYYGAAELALSTSLSKYELPSGTSLGSVAWGDGNKGMTLAVNILAAADDTSEIPITLYDSTGAYSLTAVFTVAKVKTGADGNDGTSVNIKGTVSSVSSLPAASASASSDAYVIGSDLYVFVGAGSGDSGTTDTAWKNVGQIKGDKGDNAYVHIAYAVFNSDGTISQWSTVKKDGVTYTHLGTYTDNVIADSQSSSSYVWSLIKGTDGANGLLYELVPSATAVRRILSATGALDHYDPATLTCKVKRVDGNDVSVGEFSDFSLTMRYYIDGSTGYAQYSASGVDVSAAAAASSVRFELLSGGSAIDSETVPVLRDGVNGKYTEMRYAQNSSTTVAPAIDVSAAEPSGWSLTPPASAALMYVWVSSAVKYSDGTLAGTWSNPARVSPYDGTDGKTGPALVYRGTYDDNETYVGSQSRVDCVFYSDRYYVTTVTAGSFEQIPPSTGTTNWNDFGTQFSSVATNLLLASNANIAGWIFRDDKLYSQNGRLYLDGVNGVMKMEGMLQLSASYSGNISNSNIFYLPAVTSVQELTMGYERDDIGKVCKLVNSSSATSGANYNITLYTFGLTATSGGYNTNATLGTETYAIQPQESVEFTCFSLNPSSYSSYGTFDYVGRWVATGRFGPENNRNGSSRGQLPRVVAMGQVYWSGSQVSLNGTYYDGRSITSVMSVSRSSVGNYKVTGTFPSGYKVMATGNNSNYCKANVYSLTTSSFYIQASDDDSVNDNTCDFIIFAPLYSSV